MSRRETPATDESLDVIAGTLERIEDTWLMFLFPLRFLGADLYEVAGAPAGTPPVYLVAFATFDRSVSIALEISAAEAAGQCEAWRGETEPDAAVRLAAGQAARIILATECSRVRHGDSAARPVRPPTNARE